MTSNVTLTVSNRNGRRCVTSGSPWEPIVGYSRAVRSGDWIFVTGTVGLEPDGRYGSTARQQARRSIEIILAAIESLGGKPTDVVRTRIYLANIEDWMEIGEVHSEFFESIRPATTMVQVTRLIDPEALVEIEADALIQRESENRPS